MGTAVKTAGSSFIPDLKHGVRHYVPAPSGLSDSRTNHRKGDRSHPGWYNNCCWGELREGVFFFDLTRWLENCRCDIVIEQSFYPRTWDKILQSPLTLVHQSLILVFALFPVSGWKYPLAGRASFDKVEALPQWMHSPAEPGNEK
jgi:hypothetical protein